MISVNTGVQAHFKCVAVNENGNERNLTDWFPNLVLDSGLDRMSQGAWFTRVMIGTGNSEPLITQKTLDSFLASTTAITEASSSRQTSTSPFYYSLVTVFRFAQGVAAGNISEIAIGWADNACWNRALIKDINSNPTTITVLPNEFLDVYTELRIYPKMTDTVSTVNLLNGKGAIESTHQVKVRADMSSDIPNSVVYSSGSSKITLGDDIFSRNSTYVYSDNAQLNSITEFITGSRLGNFSASNLNDSYPTSRSCSLNMALSITQLVGNHKIIEVPSRVGGWKLEYDPPISKNTNQTLEHNFILSWGRYT